MTTTESKLLLKVWERGLRSSFADIDIFINIDSEANESDYVWKLQWGSKNVEILPDDDKLRPGRYSVLMINRDYHEEDLPHQPLGVCFQLPPVPKIIDITDMNAPF